eukprot:jgi/Bigna1/143571/aug1.79_g18279
MTIEPNAGSKQSKVMRGAGSVGKAIVPIRAAVAVGQQEDIPSAPSNVAVSGTVESEIAHNLSTTTTPSQHVEQRTFHFVNAVWMQPILFHFEKLRDGTLHNCVEYIAMVKS